MNFIVRLAINFLNPESLSLLRFFLVVTVGFGTSIGLSQEGPSEVQSPAAETQPEAAPEPPAEVPQEMSRESTQVTPETPSPSPTPDPVSAEPPSSPEATADSSSVSTPEASAGTSPQVYKTVRDEQFTKPVYFESMDNLMPTMDLEYDLTLKKGESLKIGDVVIDDKSFFMALVPVSKFHPKMTAIVDGKEASKPALVFRWPEPLLQKGRIEVISRTGSVLWQHEITEDNRKNWAGKLSQWKRGLEEKGVKTEKLSKSSVFFTQFGIVDAFSNGFKSFKESFRFCLTQSQGRSQSRLCSQRYVLRGGAKETQMTRIKTVAQPRVVLQATAAPLKQTIPVSMETPTNFFAELAGGEIYEFIGIPNKLNLMDLSDTKDPKKLRIVAWGTQPTIEFTILNPDNYSKITKAIGFESTIGDMRKFWEASISADDPKIYLPGQGGGIFAQRFDLARVPQASARPYLDLNTPTGTYIDDVKIYGKKPLNVKVTSLENSIELNAKDSHYFTWYFKATDRGAMNRSYLSMEFQGKAYKAFYELHKGLPRELSLRLSGMIGDVGSIFMGEGAYNHWFEDLFGWTDFWLARQRWGISAKVFKSFTKLKVDDRGGTADITVINADLKYRLVPGLWNRDETLGAMLDYQDITFSRIKASMIGAGAFWARSMPKVFDDIFNIVPMMRYPKWVDMEFIYYPLSLSSKVSLQTNFAMNFHGKVIWTKHLFGEAGFGIKRYAIIENEVQQRALLTTFYGTVGLGLSF